MSIISVYAFGFGRLYKVDLSPLGGRFILRPANGQPYQWLTATAQQLRVNFRLFPIVGVQK